MRFFLCSCGLLLLLCTSSGTQYRNYKVFSVIPDSVEQVKALEKLSLEAQLSKRNTKQPVLEFWDEEITLNEEHKVLVPPGQLDTFHSFCVSHNLRVEIIWDDLDTLLHEQEDTSDRRVSDKASAMNWETYHRYTTITDYYLYLEKTYPAIVRRVLLGQTYEGRDMWLLKVGSLDSNGTFANLDKPGVWIDSGIHAREWISSATLTYIINQIVTNATYSWMHENINWYFLPVINVDGFDLTHTSDRMWRKTRRIDPFSQCIGTDANRNYDFRWQKIKPVADPCVNTYGGPIPYSEPENLLIFDKMMDLKRDLRAYLTFHSHGQLWMSPWGYTSKNATDYPDLLALSVSATEALSALYGTKYRVGPSSTTIYLTSGTSQDFAKGRTTAKYVYTLELRDRGKFGFLLPADQILPTGRETFEGIKVVAQRLIDEFPVGEFEQS